MNLANLSLPKQYDRKGHSLIDIADGELKKSNTANNQKAIPLRDNHARFLERKFSKHFISKNSSRLLINQKLASTVKQLKSYGPSIVDKKYLSQVQLFTDKVMCINRQNMKKINLNENMMNMLNKSRDDIIETSREDSSKKSSNHLVPDNIPAGNSLIIQLLSKSQQSRGK